MKINIINKVNTKYLFINISFIIINNSLKFVNISKKFTSRKLLKKVPLILNFKTLYLK